MPATAAAVMAAATANRALRPPGEQLRPLGQVERHDEGHDRQPEVHVVHPRFWVRKHDP